MSKTAEAVMPKADTKNKGNKPANKPANKTEATDAEATTPKASNGFTLTAAEFAALPEKTQNRIRKVRESIEEEKAAAARAEVGTKLYGSTLAKVMELGYADADKADMLTAITITSDGEVTFNKKRKTRTIKPKGENAGDNSGENDEDAERAAIKAEGKLLRGALIKFHKAEQWTQADIIRGMGRGRSPKPSQATMSNWLKGKAFPRQEYHAGLRRLLTKEEYLEAVAE